MGLDPGVGLIETVIDLIIIFTEITLVLVVVLGLVMDSGGKIQLLMENRHSVTIAIQIVIMNRSVQNPIMI